MNIFIYNWFQNIWGSASEHLICELHIYTAGGIKGGGPVLHKYFVNVLCKQLWSVFLYIEYSRKGFQF